MNNDEKDERSPSSDDNEEEKLILSRSSPKLPWYLFLFGSLGKDDGGNNRTW